MNVNKYRYIDIGRYRYVDAVIDIGRYMKCTCYSLIGVAIDTSSMCSCSGKVMCPELWMGVVEVVGVHSHVLVAVDVDFAIDLTLVCVPSQ